MPQALYRKWRPQSWEAVVGQAHVVQTLRNALTSGHIAHAYLFAGPRGTGKTTTARLLAKAVNCLDPVLGARPCGQCAHCQAVNQGRFLDLIEIDAASNTSVDDVRDLREKINFSPNQGNYKVYIIDEVHMLSTAAFNALLKTLEEPPPHAIFILATTEVHKIPATVLSRCQRHEFRRIPVNEIVAYLKRLAESESIQVEDAALTLVARQSTGAMRDAISLLDQLASSGQAITLAMAQDVLGTAASQAVLDVVDALLAHDPAGGLDCLHAAIDAGTDARQFARQLVDYLRELLLLLVGNVRQIDATAEMREKMLQQSRGFDVPSLLRLIRIFNQAANDTRSAWQPALPLEMAFIEALEPPEPPAAGGPARQPSAAARPSTRPSSQAAAPAGREPPPAFTPVPRPIQAPAEAPNEPDEAGDGFNTRLLSTQWNKIAAKVRQYSPSTHGVINSGRLLGVRDGVVYLGFKTEVVKSKMEKNENLEIFRRVLQELYGVDAPIRCVIATGKGSDLPPDVDSDGMVATAVRDLGAEIVNTQETGSTHG